MFVSPKIPMLKPQPLMWLFGDRAFIVVIKFKRDHKGGALNQ